MRVLSMAHSDSRKSMLERCTGARMNASPSGTCSRPWTSTRNHSFETPSRATRTVR